MVHRGVVFVLAPLSVCGQFGHAQYSGIRIVEGHGEQERGEGEGEGEVE